MKKKMMTMMEKVGEQNVPIISGICGISSQLIHTYIEHINTYQCMYYIGAIAIIQNSNDHNNNNRNIYMGLCCVAQQHSHQTFNVNPLNFLFENSFFFASIFSLLFISFITYTSIFLLCPKKFLTHTYTYIYIYIILSCFRVEIRIVVQIPSIKFLPALAPWTGTTLATWFIINIYILHKLKTIPSLNSCSISIISMFVPQSQ